MLSRICAEGGGTQLIDTGPLQTIAVALAQMQDYMRSMKCKLQRTDKAVRSVSQRLRAQKRIILKVDQRIDALEHMSGAVAPLQGGMPSERSPQAFMCMGTAPPASLSRHCSSSRKACSPPQSSPAASSSTLMLTGCPSPADACPPTPTIASFCAIPVGSPFRRRSQSATCGSGGGGGGSGGGGGAFCFRPASSACAGPASFPCSRRSSPGSGSVSCPTSAIPYAHSTPHLLCYGAWGCGGGRGGGPGCGGGGETVDSCQSWGGGGGGGGWSWPSVQPSGCGRGSGRQAGGCAVAGCPTFIGMGSHAAIESRMERQGQRLLKAAQKGSARCVRHLLDAGADPNYATPGKWTALHRAAAKGHANIVSMLLKRGASVNSRNLYGFTALHIAAYDDCRGKCVKLLIDAGADMGSRNRFGRTALHYAAECGNLCAIKVLLAHGANTLSKDDEGHTPVQLARTVCVRRLLRNCKQKPPPRCRLRCTAVCTSPKCPPCC